MKAICIESPGKMAVVDMLKPAVATPYDVLIRITSGSICGSDIGIYKGTNSLASYPAIIGHEYGGVIEAVGDLVTGVKPGDLVAVDPVRVCGHCYACATGRQNVCSTVRVTGVHMPGGFAEYVTAPCDRVHRVDPAKIGPDTVCLVEPYSIGVQVNKRGRVMKGDRVLVIGCGPAGLCIMQDAKARGARVMMSDVVDPRLKEARDMGADRTVNVKSDDLAKAVADFTDGEGMPVVIDAACTVQSFPQALDMASPAGRVVILGLSDKPSEVASVAITKKELDVMGTRLNNRRFPEVIDGFEQGLYTPGKLRSHTFHFTEVQKAFDLILERPGEVRKVTLNFT
ncbi:MAG: zinc-binding alcohol dehydrogenase family protein [Planctomycetota bacterium]|jgi:L-gulonate 5-dehydrogenase|nr:zinc-binding alcohol dehydrogenase family protein [Planctomycetota bacterium]